VTDGQNTHDLDLSQFGEWKASVQGVRDCALGMRIAAPDLSFVRNEEHARYRPTQDEVELIADMVATAANAGRLIDFGHLPNAVIMECGSRSGILFDAGALLQPFSDPWLFMHTWEGGGEERPSVAAYLVNPIDFPTGRVEVVEFQPVTYATSRLLAIGDRGLLLGAATKEDAGKRYTCQILPSIWRLLGSDLSDELNQHKTPEGAAAGNLFDPLLTVLTLLQVRGVPRETVRVDEKLQRARARSGKPRLPSYQRVDSTGYVTALLAKQSPHRRLSDGGTHASPRWHLRRGTVRSYPSGKKSVIMDTLVNVDPEVRAAFKAGTMDIVGARAAYVSRQQKETPR
jgi:hypothetical protein